MYTFFTGKMASDRGSLFHAKNIFGHHSVKANVSECFNHISDLIEQITDAYTILLTMSILDLQSVDGTPTEDIASMDKIQKREYLRSLCSKVVDAVWQDIGIDPIRQAIDGDEDEEYPYCICGEGIDYSDRRDILIDKC